MFVPPTSGAVGAMVRGPVGASVGAPVAAVSTLGAEVVPVGDKVAAVGWAVEIVGAAVITVGAMVARGNDGAIVGDCVRPAVGVDVGDAVRPNVGADVCSTGLEGPRVGDIVGVLLETGGRLGAVEGDFAGKTGIPLKGGKAPK